jgi:hypothetical protein
VQIGHRPIQEIVEVHVGGFDPRVPQPHPPDLRRDVVERHVVRDRRRTGGLDLAGKDGRETFLALGRDRHLEADAIGGHFRRGGKEPGADAPANAVEPQVSQDDLVGTGFRRQEAPPPVAADAAHLENVREIGGKQKRGRHADFMKGEIAHTDPLVADALPEKAHPEKVQRVARQDHAVSVRDVGIGQVDDEDGALLAHRGTQKKRPVRIQAELKAAQEPCPLVVEALLALSDGSDVAVEAEDGERVAVLEDLGAVVHPRRGRQDVVLVLDADDLFHRAIGARPHVPARSPEGRASARRVSPS